MTLRGIAGSVLLGWARSTLLVALGLAIPAVAAVLPLVDGALGSPWSVANPWTWVGYLVLFASVALVGTKLVCQTTARLVLAWTGASMELRSGATRDMPPVVQLATGYWWNGFSYERSRRDAEADQRWRRFWGYPGFWQDLRWVVVAAVVMVPMCLVPVASLGVALLLLSRGRLPLVASGAVLVVVSGIFARYAWRLGSALAVRCLDASTSAGPHARVRQLESQRADLTIAQAAELRRIERNLHDGAQARLVGVGLSLATAEALLETDPAQARALLREAKEGTSHSLAELRSLVRGIDPPVLVERGLVDAVRALALDSPVDTTVEADPRVRLEPPLEAALYFGVAELLANAGKYAPGACALVALRREGDGVLCSVTDDGPGGATSATGGGLAGILRRLSAFDGRMTVDSPPGGPTTVQMWVPCASS